MDPAPSRHPASTAGFYRANARWLLAGFVLTATSSFGQTFFISLFAGEIRAEFGLTDGAWGAIYTVATLTSAAVLFQAGVLVDRIPLRRLALGVIALYATAALGMALNPVWWGLLPLVFLLRLCGQGMMSHMAMTTMGRWFRARRGRAVAFAGLGFSAGEAVLPTIGVLAIAGIGWRGAWGAVALVLLCVAAPLLAWLLSERRTPQGQLGVTEQPGLMGRQWERREVLRHWSFWTLAPAMLTTSFVGTVLFFQQVHIAGEKGWSLEAMTLGYPVYAGAVILAALTGGTLVDRFGPLRLLPVFLGPLIVGTALLGPAEASTTWIGVLGLLGLSQGLSQAIWGTLWPELYGTRNLGAIRSVSTAAMVFSTAAGPGITGLLIDAGYPFPDQAIWLAVLAAGITGISYVAMRRLLRLQSQR